MISRELYIALKEQEQKNWDHSSFSLSGAAREVIEDTRLSWQDKANGILRLIDYEDGVTLYNEQEAAAYGEGKDKLVVKASRIAFDVEINMSARDWEAYTTGEFAATCEGNARTFNVALEVVLQTGAESWIDLYRMCANVQGEKGFREAGFNDSEPNYHLIQLLRELGMPDGIV